MNNFTLNSLGLNLNKKKLENVETFLNSKKESLINALGPNPLTTPVGIKIDVCTSPEVTTDDWAKYLEICDIINSAAEGPKDASRAIRKKLLLYAGKYNHAIVIILNLLDCCVKNCGHRFHLFVSQREFVHDLIKILDPKYQLSIPVQEKILKLIQTWASAFQSYPDLQGIVQINTELKAKGIEVPITPAIFSNTNDLNSDDNARSLNQEAPIFTPSVSKSLLIRTPSDPPSQNNSPNSIPDTTHNLDVAKLKNELDIVQTNVQLLNDILNDKMHAKIQPSWDFDDITLINKLNSICHEMQDRILDLLSNISNEEILTDLLRVNDDLNEAFVKYDKFQKLSQLHPITVNSKQTLDIVERKDLKISTNSSDSLPFVKRRGDNNDEGGSKLNELGSTKRDIFVKDNSKNPYTQENQQLAASTSNRPIDEPSLIKFDDEDSLPTVSSNPAYLFNNSRDITLEQIDPYYSKNSTNIINVPSPLPSSSDNSLKIQVEDINQTLRKKPLALVSTGNNDIAAKSLLDNDFEKIMNGTMGEKRNI